MTLNLGTHDFMARPDVPNGRALILIPEYWGLVDHIKDVARRFANEGFLAVGVDLFEGETTDDPDKGRALAQSLDPEIALRRVRETAERVARHLDTGDGSVGVIGWCMGGSLAFRCTGADLGIGAVVGFYGRPPSAEAVAASAIPTLGVFGSEDHVYPVEEIRATARSLRRNSAIHRFVIAEGKHAFFNDTRPSFHEDSAALAWELSLGWFRYWLRITPNPDR